MEPKKKKKRTNHKKILVKKEIVSKIGPNTLKNIKENNYKIIESSTATSKANAYSVKNPVAKFNFNNDCDLLEYSIVVKPFIYKRYHIKHPIELDILCYLYPKQFFTRSDFTLLPAQMYNYQFKTLIELGYIEKCVDNRVNFRVIWRLTEFAMKIVKDYYLLLSGERTINLQKSMNPFNNEDNVKADKIRERIMLKLKSQSEKHPERFKKYY